MKRADAQRAIDAAFVDVIGQEYRNLLMIGLSADRPNRAKVKEQFVRSLAINLEAFAMASDAVRQNPDLED